ncbi:hypothetical protein [Fodinibius sp.]|uniref:hypothetical protein n=1 Tax=Fodinibius sp. TaxID=1872440 RepID=UPI002ACD2045|nr:hypothetical protein [Fodinibius sp.]MDZ7659287.1 hypothetical protein [Fodinibius sp.]
MIKRRINISTGLLLIMLLGISLSFSTLHSHHNLELHNSSEFADTGHCITSDDTLCPICAHLIESDLISISESDTAFFKAEKRITFNAEEEHPGSVITNRGRSPPVLG